jgi:hypothetical protein
MSSPLEDLALEGDYDTARQRRTPGLALTVREELPADSSVRSEERIRFNRKIKLSHFPITK